MGHSPRRLIKRSVLAMVLALGAIGVPASLNIPLAHADNCYFDITATPGSQVVHPSYGDQATITGARRPAPQRGPKLSTRAFYIMQGESHTPMHGPPSGLHMHCVQAGAECVG